MADQVSSILPTPSPEQMRAAAGQFERANQVIATGNFDYGIQLLLTCCKLDPVNIPYRMALRRAEKAKFKNNMYGSKLAVLTTSAGKMKVKSALRARDYLKVFECAEEVLAKNPWDAGVQLDMAEAAEALGLTDLAVWTLDQARQKDPKDATVNRALARLYERRNDFVRALRLWAMVRAVDPTDDEAQRKARDLAASETIARGNYESRTQGEQPAGDNDEVEAPARAEAAPPPTVSDRLAKEAAVLRARVEADPTNPHPYLHLANLYRRADRLEEAREVLEQGIEPTGPPFDLITELAELELETFRNNLAVTEGKLKTRPKDETLRQMRANLLSEIAGLEVDLYRQADRHPSDKSHRFELGVRLFQTQQLDEAIRELQTIRSDPRYQGRALMYLGLCFKARNNWRLAQRNLEEALQHLPASEEAARKEVLFNLAQGCADAGDLSKAADWGHELANMDFNYRDISRLLDQWEDRLRKGDSAEDDES